MPTRVRRDSCFSTLPSSFLRSPFSLPSCWCLPQASPGGRRGSRNGPSWRRGGGIPPCRKRCAISAGHRRRGERGSLICEAIVAVVVLTIAAAVVLPAIVDAAAELGRQTTRGQHLVARPVFEAQLRRAADRIMLPVWLLRSEQAFSPVAGGVRVAYLDGDPEKSVSLMTSTETGATELWVEGSLVAAFDAAVETRVRPWRTPSGAPVGLSLFVSEPRDGIGSGVGGRHGAAERPVHVRFGRPGGGL